MNEVFEQVTKYIEEHAIAFKNGSLRGTIPKKIKEDCALCATGMFAASVGIRLNHYTWWLYDGVKPHTFFEIHNGGGGISE